MSTYDDTDRDEHPVVRRLIGVGLFLLAQGIAVIVIGFLALLVSFVPSWSATPEPAALLQPGEASSGMPLVQVFRNPIQSWVEATYLYPLATNAAIEARSRSWPATVSSSARHQGAGNPASRP